MEFWTAWLDALRWLLYLLSSDVGIGTGAAIVLVTLLLRTALLPVSWSLAYGGGIRQKKLLELQPQLQRLRESAKARPDLYAERVFSLYRRHGLRPVDGKSIVGALIQLPVFLGMFHVLREGIGNGRFLWIRDLASPDGMVAIVAGLTTALMMAVVPDMPEHMRAFMLVLPSLVVVLVAFKLASALCLYWTVSNCFSAAQTATAAFLINRRIRSGALEL